MSAEGTGLNSIYILSVFVAVSYILSVCTNSITIHSEEEAKEQNSNCRNRGMI